MNIFGNENFVDIFRGSAQIRLYLGVIFMHIWVFFKVNVQNGVFFFGGGGLLKFQIFLGAVEILFFWGGGGRERKMLGPSLRMK